MRPFFVLFMNNIKIAISSCLMGNAVRYDGKHKRSIWLQDLSAYGFEFVPICPEVEIGMTVPRPPIHLVKDKNGISVKLVEDHQQDFTESFLRLAEDKVTLLQTCVAYICAEKSPSCGFKTTPIVNTNSEPLDDIGSGIFMQRVRQLFPGLIIINHCELADEEALQNFVRKLKVTS